MTIQNDSVIRVLQGKPVKKTPIWIMRQAGRYLPEYRKLRKETGSFLNLCRSPELACQTTLMPIERYDLDAAIIFSDILVVPEAMGMELRFEEKTGPIFSKPIRNETDFKKLNTGQIFDSLTYVFEAIQLTKKELNDRIPLIGFSGSPWTLACYMIEGGTSKTHSKIKKFVKDNKKEALDLMKIITELSIEYLKKQIESGANYIQIFESWAGLLENDEYIEFIVKPNKHISDEIKKDAKRINIIHFPRGSGKNYKIFAEEVYCDVLSLDHSYPQELLGFLREKNVTVQGNLDPKELLGDAKNVEEKTKEVLEKFKSNNHIFNLSHGILPSTNISNIETVIKVVREHETSK